MLNCRCRRIDGRVVEGARLEIVCTSKAYREFESHSIRHFFYKDTLSRVFFCIQGTGEVGSSSKYGAGGKNFSSGGIFNDRRTFVGFEPNDSVGEKRYKWSVRSELAKAKSLSL